MGTPHTAFLNLFKARFAERFGPDTVWNGGQGGGNVARLDPVLSLRRDGLGKPNERFELGDLRADIPGRTVIVEYDQAGAPLSNLVKFWPYVRAELDIKPVHPVLLCHFTNWGSWGAHRDLWHWTQARICEDANRRVGFSARLFDHGLSDASCRDTAIAAALDWIGQAGEG